MAKLLLKINGQTLTAQYDIPKIVEGSIQYLDYEVQYSTKDKDWNSCDNIEVFFTHDGDTPPPGVKKGKIPSSVIQTPGFTVAILGKKGSDYQITTEPITIRVYPSGNFESNISKPDEDVIQAWYSEIFHTATEAIDEALTAQKDAKEALLTAQSTKEIASQALLISKNVENTSQNLLTELSNARIGIDDTVYSSTGEAIREQIKPLSDKFKIIGKGRNLFNINDPEIIENSMLNGTDDGITGNKPTFFVSGFIEVEENTKYFPTVYVDGARKNYMRTYAFYDINKSYISGSSTTFSSAAGLTIPTGVKYIRFTTYNSNSGGSKWQFEKDLITEYEEYHLLYVLSDTVIGSSMRTNIQNNDALVKTSATLNLLDINKIITEQGYTYGTGVLAKNSTLISSPLIWIKGFDNLVIQMSIANKPNVCVFFDENEDYIVSYKYGSSGDYPEKTNVSPLLELGAVCTIPIPEGAVYCGISVPNTINQNTLMIYGVKGENVYPNPVAYQEYVEAYRHKQEILPTERFIRSYFNGKKLVTLGDSITAPSVSYIPWGNQIASMFNMEYVNYGIGGSEIAVNFADSTYTPMCIRFAEMDDDADLIIVAGGTNDWGHNTDTSVSTTKYQIGEFGDTDTTTFYGALDILCKGLLTKYPGKNIMFMTPIKRATTQRNYYEPNGNGNTLEDYANAIKKVCGFYGIPVLDMFNECILNPIIEGIKTAYVPDGTHPNFEGHKIMARQVAGYISKLANEFNYN